MTQSNLKILGILEYFAPIYNSLNNKKKQQYFVTSCAENNKFIAINYATHANVLYENKG